MMMTSRCLHPVKSDEGELDMDPGVHPGPGQLHGALAAGSKQAAHLEQAAGPTLCSHHFWTGPVCR